jgi:hypothetical protein
MKTLHVKTIYIPNREHIAISKKAIIEFSTIDCDMVLIGWVIPDCLEEMKEFLLDYDHILIPDNRGKIWLLRNLTTLIDWGKYDTYLYSDHDLYPGNFKLENNLFGMKYHNKEITTITYNQEGDNRHNPLIYHNQLNLLGHCYYWCNRQILIASGCFLFSKKMLHLMSELYSKHCYGDEDILLGNLHDKHNVFNIVSNYTVFHPPLYRENKENIVKQIIG